MSNIELLPHQITGRDFLLEKQRAMLCDSVGLGKTVQAIAALEKEGYTALIFAPRPLLRQWSKEIRKFSVFIPAIVTGSRKQREQLYHSGKPIFLINYDKAPIDIELLTHELRGRIDCIILDEAQRIKNYKASRSKAIKQLANDLNIENRWILTATPMENRIDELYSLLDFLNYGVLEDLTKLATPIRGGSYRGYTYERAGLAGPPKRKDFMNALNGISKERLQTLLNDVMLRRSQIDGMPPTVKDYYLEMSQHQKKLHNQFLNDFQVTVEDREFDVTNALAKMTRLRQIANTPALIVPFDEITPKVQEIIAIAQDMISFDEKVIFFSEFREMTNYIRDQLLKIAISPAYIHGGPECNTEDEIEKFRADHHIMLATKSGEEGLNLQFAHNIVNIDLPYNPARVTQRIGRCHRIGQSQQVRVINLITEGSIEENIKAMLYDKQCLFDDIINGHNKDVVLDRETIRRLAYS